MMKAIFFFLFLFSHILGLEASFLIPLERSGRTILSHGNIAYIPETHQIAPSGRCTTFRIINMAGMRVSFAYTRVHMNKAFMRAIYKTNISLKASFTHQAIILNCLVFKMMLAQSWLILIYRRHFVPGHAFMSTSGPGFDSSNSNRLNLSTGMTLITTGLKTMIFSSTELSSMATRFANSNSALNNTPLFASNDVFNRFASSSSGYNAHKSSVVPDVRGFPYHGISRMFIHSFTLQDCEKAAQNWKNAPLEIFIMDNVNYSNINIIDIVLPIWQEQLPRTDYIANGNRTGFLTIGEETIIPCQGGVSGDQSLLLVINLGILSDKSLIAADLVITQFQTYANAKGKLLNSGVTYRCKWALFGGCVAVMIQLVPPSVQMLTDKTNQIGMMREAFQQFRMNFTLQDIAINLSSNWSDSLGTNQQNRNLWNWFRASNSNYINPCAYWWNETLNNAPAFENLRNLALNVAAGTASVNLYQEIYDIIQISFLPRSRRFDIWIFEKA